VLNLTHDETDGKALEAVRDWPQDRQDEAAALLLAAATPIVCSTPYLAVN
jgi:hypothetical protein